MNLNEEYLKRKNEELNIFYHHLTNDNQICFHNELFEYDYTIEIITIQKKC